MHLKQKPAFVSKDDYAMPPRDLPDYISKSPTAESLHAASIAFECFSVKITCPADKINLKLLSS